MPNCAFLSIKRTDGWFIDDDLVHQPLKDLGWQVENVPWDKDEDWDKYDAVVIRSTWDYQHRLEEFIKVLKRIDQSKVILLNTLETVLWNIDKRYLLDLESKGVEIVPTVIIDNPSQKGLVSSIKQFNIPEIVIKPTISASADDTFRLTEPEINEANWIEEKFSGRSCLVQPFMNGITNEGEYSLMYIKGKIAHTILKSVKKGDYRVQEEHGGIVRLVDDPEDHLISTGNRIIASLDHTPFYARVDVVRTAHNSFALMELELIEPSMYFRFHEASALQFAREINGVVS